MPLAAEAQAHLGVCYGGINFRRTQEAFSSLVEVIKLLSRIYYSSMAFFKQLCYTFGNEDWITEKDALRINPSDRVLCITAVIDR